MYKKLISEQKDTLLHLTSLPFTPRTASANAAGWLSSNLIKIIVGPRRAGKSRFALHLLQHTNFAYFNFEDDRLHPASFDSDLFLRELSLIYRHPAYYFFDEIQNVPRWETWVNRLHRHGLNLIVTGSNSRLLSGELASALTGRHIPIEILPFSFSEYQHALPSPSLDDFLDRGGYPEVITQNLDPAAYLTILLNAILFQDIVKRHNIRYPNLLNNLARHLIAQSGNTYSLRRLTRTLGFHSGVTLEKYLSYLIDAYLVFSLTRYSYKSSLRLTAPRKLYTVDNGLLAAVSVPHSGNAGQYFENLVFLELVKSGLIPNQTLFYYQTRNNREVDFVLKRGHQTTHLIQVAYSLTDPDTLKREIKSLTEAGNELKAANLILVTTRPPAAPAPKNISIITLPALIELITGFDYNLLVQNFVTHTNA